MVFRTVGAIAALLIGVAWQDGQARAQYYSPQSSAQPMVGQQYGLRPLMPIEVEPNVTGTLGSNPRSHMVALQPNPRPEAGPAKYALRSSAPDCTVVKVASPGPLCRHADLSRVGRL
jgi:hypothetical protein